MPKSVKGQPWFFASGTAHCDAVKKWSPLYRQAIRQGSQTASAKHGAANLKRLTTQKGLPQFSLTMYVTGLLTWDLAVIFDGCGSI